jgi:inorganic pyrophosphatase
MIFLNITRNVDKPVHTIVHFIGFVGDDDPIDAIELSDEPCEMGKVYRVKVLAALGMIDGNETDWKVIYIMLH